MELIKDIVKQLYPILIMVSCVLFVIYVFFTASYNGGEGVFENSGKIYAPMLEANDVKNDGLSYMNNTADSYVPVIKYNSGTKSVGDCVNFKSLFLVQLKDGTYVNGETEAGYALYLKDIKSESGSSVLESLSTQEIENLEEIPAAFIYDPEKDLLYIFRSGIYTVEIKIYGDAGAVEQYEFNLPVEVP